MRFLTHSAEETIAVAREIAPLLPTRGPVLLIGNLGAGKTTLVKGLAEARGVTTRDEVSSPTFPIIHEYGDPVALYHVDLYRLETEAEVWGIGIEELLDRPIPTLIEWGERFPNIFPPDTPRILLERLSEEQRSIEVLVQQGNT
jgi:tRNA threonylcarbamoyladenosine biosynthesis protein TsaE